MSLIIISLTALILAIFILWLSSQRVISDFLLDLGLILLMVGGVGTVLFVLLPLGKFVLAHILLILFFVLRIILACALLLVEFALIPGLILLLMLGVKAAFRFNIPSWMYVVAAILGLAINTYLIIRFPDTAKDVLLFSFPQWEI